MANRYDDLLAALPRGKFYQIEEGSTVLPYQDAPHEFEFRTNKANRRFIAYVGDVEIGEIMSDIDGRAIVRTVRNLAPGEYEIRILDPLDSTITRDYVSIKHLAAWLDMYATVLNEMDVQIDEMDAARSIETVTPTYIQEVYGAPLRAPKLSSFVHEDYRRQLIQMRSAFRHFGGHPYGLSQVVEAFTSVSPFIVPKEWRPFWVVGTNVLGQNGDLASRSRMVTQQYAPPGASTPILDFPDLNRQLRFYVHPNITGTVTSGFRQPPEPGRITVTIADTNRMTVEGTDENGDTVSEIIPDPAVTAAAGTYYSQNIFTTITEATKSGTAGLIGLGDKHFVRVTRVGDFNRPALAKTLYYDGLDADDLPQFTLDTGESTLGPEQGLVTLKDIGRAAKLFGIVEVAAAGTFNLDPLSGTLLLFHDRLWLEIDDRGVLGIDIGEGSATVTPATAATRINDAFNADTRYGASYNAVASVITGTEGDNDLVLSIRAPNELTTSNRSRVKIHPGPCDAAPVQVFNLPRSSSRLTANAGSTLTCVSTQQMPDVATADPAPFRRRFDARVRGLRLGITAGSLNAILSDNVSMTMRVSLSPTYTFSAADVGGYVRWADGENPAANDGLHKIIGLAGAHAILLHENPELGVEFDVGGDGTSTGFGAVYAPGEIVTVTNNNKSTNVLTLLAAPAQTWLAGAIVEVVDDTPYTADGSLGIGEIDLDVDTTFRPYHDFGDSISFVSGTTWRITSLRATFSGASGNVIISGATNAENNGTFPITAAGTTTLDFTNANAVAETSEFEWALEALPSTLDDALTPQGASMPDGWRVMSAATTVTLGNSSGVSSTQAPGLYTPSRVILASANNIQFQKNFLEALVYRGLPLTATFWVQEHTANSTEYQIDVSFDDGSTFFEVEAVDLNSTILEITNVRGPLNPTAVAGTFYVPYDATTCIIRLTRTPDVAAAGTMSFERFVLHSATGTSLAMGENTVLRSQKRTKFGELLYIWSPETLPEEDLKALGLSPDGSSSQPATVSDDGLSLEGYKQGHIDRVTSAHAYWDRVDVSEIDDTVVPGVRLNLRGVYDDTDWDALATADTLEMLTSVAGTPPRMSHIKPSRASLIEEETLTMSDGGGGSGIATLSLTSNHEGAYPQAPNTGTGTGARLYELRIEDTTITLTNGLVSTIPAGAPIPLPDSVDEDSVQPWEFTAANAIRVNSPYFNSTSTYVIDYDVLMRATSEAIELEAPEVTMEDYVWLADLAHYKRHNVEERNRSRLEQLNFLADYTAQLSERADTNEAATITRNNGLVTETVPSINWVFTNSKTVRLDPGVFDTNSIYSIEYQARVPHIESAVNVRLEWRSATTEGGLTAASWIEVENNQVLSPVYTAGADVTVNAPRAWHQMRVTVTGVVDPETDLRIYGFGLKGIHLFGANAYAPGVVTSPDVVV